MTCNISMTYHGKFSLAKDSNDSILSETHRNCNLSSGYFSSLKSHNCRRLPVLVNELLKTLAISFLQSYFSTKFPAVIKYYSLSVNYLVFIISSKIFPCKVVHIAAQWFSVDKVIGSYHFHVRHQANN